MTPLALTAEAVAMKIEKKPEARSMLFFEGVKKKGLFFFSIKGFFYRLEKKQIFFGGPYGSFF
jgi:hypothetical protein